MRTKSKKFLLKRSAWVLITVFFAVFFVIAMIGRSLANDFQAAINGVFGTNPYRKIVAEGTTGEDTDYYKSDYTKKDENGNTVYEKDEDGVWHPVYDDVAMHNNSQEVALQAAVEGSVLLWNNNDTLPLEKNSPVTFVGISSANYRLSGLGSGAVNCYPPETLGTEIKNSGLSYSVANNSLTVMYRSLLMQQYEQDRNVVNEVPWSVISEIVNGVSAQETAVMIISRVSGEGGDLIGTKGNNLLDPGNYLELSADEKEIIDNLVKMREAGKIKSVVLLINGANSLQFKTISTLGIDACVWVGIGGNMSYAQIAAVLSGKGNYVVSGRLPDTFVMDNASIPSNVNFGDRKFTEYSDDLPDLKTDASNATKTQNTKYLVYQEGIYVGYRYYETRYEDAVMGKGYASSSAGAKASSGNWSYSEEVAFPFGYGLSYTDFTYSDFKAEKNKNGDYDVSLTITNSGTKYNGKEVMQVYLQKPYTTYDKTHGIEKSAVELVGFAKTGVLQPGKPQTLTVTVAAEEFKTYDAYGERSYILEEGDYYLAVGTDSHDALNNILAKKGYGLSNGMDKAGNASFAQLIHIDADDFETYKTSVHTGEKIENRFDDADINIYEGTEDQKITYLSRSNWQDTYPTSAVSLKCVNERMVEDMQYGHPIEVKEGDTLPVYEQIDPELGELTIAMLMDLPYDDPMWDSLLNQMSVGEQQFMMSYGLHHLAGAESVGAPGAEAHDGSNGINVGNPRTGLRMGFPCETLLAATFDTALIARLGNAFGMEILHSGYTVIYGPGADTHRSPYSGRNFEYYSEDGFLAGKMLAAELPGMQKYGAIVEVKHFALNDQEANRYGIAIFANEQTIREVYLRSFEIGITEGKANAVMSSFNRIGCTWSGAHKGLLTDVLRTEWGFNGMVETDSCSDTTTYVHHMASIHAAAEGLLAGNDVWMCGSGDEGFIKDYEGNATVMLALRESVHRVLYAQLHSNAMNGMDASTRIIKVRVWWQNALDGLAIGMGVITGILLLITVISFIFCSAWYARQIEKARNTRAKINSGELKADTFGKKLAAMGKKGEALIWAVSIALVIVIVLSIVLPVTLTRGAGNNPNGGTSGGPGGVGGPGGNVEDPPIVHVCAHVCDECGKCLSDCTDPACADKCEGHEHKCTSICPECGLCYDVLCEEQVCSEKCGDGKTAHVFEAEDAESEGGKRGPLTVVNGNDGKVVGNLNNNQNATVTFYIDSSIATTASLFVTVSLRGIDTVFTDVLLLEVNGRAYPSNTVVPGSESGLDAWSTYVRLNLGCVNLKKGKNTLKFAVYSASEISGYNFDRIELLCDAELAWHEPHECSSVCSVCGKCTDEACDKEECADKCEYLGREYKLEAEDGTYVDFSGKITLGDGKKHLGDLTDDQYLDTDNNNAAGNEISFSIVSEAAGKLHLFVNATCHNKPDLFSDSFKLYVNGAEVTSGPYMAATYAVAEGAGNPVWNSWGEADLGEIDVAAGENIIKFVSTGGRNGINKCGGNIDYFYMIGTSRIYAVEPHECSAKCPECGKCLDITCDRAACAEKCDCDPDEHTFKLEAEDENVALSSPAKKTSDGGNNCVGELNNKKGGSIGFWLYSPFTSVHELYVNATCHNVADKFSDGFDLFVNGVKVDSDEYMSATYAVAEGASNPVWRTWGEVALGTIVLKQGNNFIQLVSTGVTAKGSNVDYFRFVGNSELSVTKPFEFDGSETRYEAEYADAVGNAKIEGSVCTDKDGFTSLEMGNLNNEIGSGLTFTVHSTVAQNVKIVLGVTQRSVERAFNTVFDAVFNGEALDVSDDVKLPKGSGDKWFESVEIELCEIALAADDNTITFTVKVTGMAVNFDYIKLVPVE